MTSRGGGATGLRGGTRGRAKLGWECEDGSCRGAEAQKAEGGSATSAEVRAARRGEEGDGTRGEPRPTWAGAAGWCWRSWGQPAGPAARGVARVAGCSLPSWFGPCSGAFPALAAAIGQSEQLARGPSLPLAPRAGPRGLRWRDPKGPVRSCILPRGVAGTSPVLPGPRGKIQFLGFFSEGVAVEHFDFFFLPPL